MNSIHGSFDNLIGTEIFQARAHVTYHTRQSGVGLRRRAE